MPIANSIALEYNTASGKSNLWERSMNILLVIAFLFFVGAMLGWVLEFLFRNLISHSGPRAKHFINPGFCKGPYLPIYGVGLTVLFLIAYMETRGIVEATLTNELILFASMAVTMTIIEYIAGLISLKGFHVRLWDYSDEWGNIQGIICPKFSLIWGVLGVAYYLLVHPNILDALDWLSENLAFSFFVGMFYGVFIIDLVYSTSLITKLKKLSDEYNVVVRYEELKARIRASHEERRAKYRFFQPLRSDRNLSEYVKAMKASREERKEKFKARFKK